ncbi:hypothetical protein ED312_09380 [Sinomicrobium pectinilyticum]|uniref:Uncharacterized protein n=1 Tax=Sinomicrobium pectinilyticum TaxID=1084421 RepID=A0A3N0EJ25_SINP1|nr:hypothetical protein [Sinomicrobium pectinilyticum]RNL87831.1 hypothetical protein ED312_09380 [Sinomicrobium pectinilyticum]
MKNKIVKLIAVVIAILLVQLALLCVHRNLPGYERFRDCAEKTDVDMNALFYSEEKHTSDAARCLRDKVRKMEEVNAP